MNDNKPLGVLALEDWDGVIPARTGLKGGPGRKSPELDKVREVVGKHRKPAAVPVFRRTVDGKTETFEDAAKRTAQRFHSKSVRDSLGSITIRSRAEMKQKLENGQEHTGFIIIYPAPKDLKQGATQKEVQEMKGRAPQPEVVNTPTTPTNVTINAPRPEPGEEIILKPNADGTVSVRHVDKPGSGLTPSAAATTAQGQGGGKRNQSRKSR